jgi:hypothetical protein
VAAVSAEHGPVQWHPEDQDGEVAGGDRRVVHPQEPAFGESLQPGRERGEHPLLGPLVVGARQLREAAGLSDHQPAQLEHLRLHLGGEVPAGQLAQVLLQVAGVPEGEVDQLDELLGSVGDAKDDVAEQPLLSAKCL